MVEDWTQMRTWATMGSYLYKATPVGQKDGSASAPDTHIWDKYT